MTPLLLFPLAVAAPFLQATIPDQQADECVYQIYGQEQRITRPVEIDSEGRKTCKLNLKQYPEAKVIYMWSRSSLTGKPSEPVMCWLTWKTYKNRKELEIHQCY